MPYSDEADLNLDDRRLVELTDTELAPGAKNTAVILREGWGANGEIDLKLRRLYIVPIAVAVPSEIRSLHADIWRYRIFKHRDAMNIPDQIAEGYKVAHKTLDMIADRKILLDIPKTAASPVISAMVV